MIVPEHTAGGPVDPRDLAGSSVLVVGAGVSGAAAARALRGLGGVVTVADDAVGAGVRDASGEGGDPESRAVIGTAEARRRLESFRLVVVSPGIRPDNPLCRAAQRLGIPIWGDVELAWRCDRSGMHGPPRRWLAVTGTNGKTTTTSMLQAILAAAGVASVACGNIGLPVGDALLSEPRADVLVLELSSFQLHWAPSVVPEVAAVLNIAQDHLDWHGGMEAYVRAKAQVLRGRVAVVGLDDPVASSLVGRTDAGRVVGFTAREPHPGELGVEADGMLIDRAFVADDATTGIPLVHSEDISPAGRAGLLDALAAAAVARAVDVPGEAVAAGLAAFSVGPHRATHVATIAGVDYIDDSKATNPHAALASIVGHRRVVWIAGGLLKGASVDDLVRAAADTLAAAVLIGRDRGVIAEALLQHAPDVPVTMVSKGHDDTVRTAEEDRVTRVTVGTDGVAVAEAVMDGAVAAASGYARRGDTVLLAPAAASLDMFRDYGARGDAFIAAVTNLRSGGRAGS